MIPLELMPSRTPLWINPHKKLPAPDTPEGTGNLNHVPEFLDLSLDLYDCSGGHDAKTVLIRVIRESVTLQHLLQVVQDHVAVPRDLDASTLEDVSRFYNHVVHLFISCPGLNN